MCFRITATALHKGSASCMQRSPFLVKCWARQQQGWSKAVFPLVLDRAAQRPPPQTRLAFPFLQTFNWSALSKGSRRKFGTLKRTKSLLEQKKTPEKEKVVIPITKSKETTKDFTHYKERIKVMWKKYGKLALVNWFGTYFLTLGSFYVGFDQGLLLPSTWVSSEDGGGPMAIFTYLESYGMLRPYILKLKASKTAQTFLIAWLATKVTEPLRMGWVLVSTPTIARWIGYRAAGV